MADEPPNFGVTFRPKSDALPRVADDTPAPESAAPPALTPEPVVQPRPEVGPRAPIYGVLDLTERRLTVEPELLDPARKLASTLIERLEVLSGAPTRVY